LTSIAQHLHPRLSLDEQLALDNEHAVPKVANSQNLGAAGEWFAVIHKDQRKFQFGTTQAGRQVLLELPGTVTIDPAQIFKDSWFKSKMANHSGA
jgi:hypothetical protein